VHFSACFLLFWANLWTKNALTNINFSCFVLYFFIKISFCRCIVLLSWQVLQMRKERTAKISFFSTHFANIEYNKRSTKFCSCLLWYFLYFFWIIKFFFIGIFILITIIIKSSHLIPIKPSYIIFGVFDLLLFRTNSCLFWFRIKINFRFSIKHKLKLMKTKFC
jgi:hypothetical protein